MAEGRLPDVAGGALVVIAGPLIGVLLILVTDAPFWLVNVIAGIVYAVAMPLVALVTAYVYFDARTRASSRQRASSPNCLRRSSSPRRSA
jgi:predicted membrane metal-binding protein